MADPRHQEAERARRETSRGFGPEGFFDAFGALTADLRLLVWAFALVSVGLAWSQYRMAVASPVQAYVVSVDEVGRASVVQGEPVRGSGELEARVIEAELRQLVIDMRTVYPAADGEAVRQRLAAATYLHLRGAAVETYNAWMADPEEDPRILGEHELRQVRVETVVLLDRLEAGASRWLVEWAEEKGRIHGYARTDRRQLRGVFTVERADLTTLNPSDRAEFLARNPMGLIVPRFEINDVTKGEV